ncbi:uncharacterized protein LOC124152870 [Haliotis rufescens]|uniref:uncharacterized protein LOC124152870 n=1 Tax=Haliotis rufescens TaxID=6454 RepID=UPI00201F49A1|nr:uncharacterized protein LOC124152870 [Haliotis rufescens]XP_048247964.1 uncharacterized protein LOC124152870 [Haliotis rufescens]
MGSSVAMKQGTRVAQQGTRRHTEQGTTRMLMLYPRRGPGAAVGIYVTLLLTTTSLLQTAAIPAPVSDRLTTYTHGENICLKCKPGTFLHSHCSRNFTFSVCHRCPPQHFQTYHTQATRCAPCHAHCLHDRNMVQVQGCSATHDMLCECREGYFEQKQGVGYAEIRHCSTYTPCQPGQVVVKKGTKVSDQECGHCASGFYFQGGNCKQCTLCSDNSTVLKHCSHNENTICSELDVVHVEDEVGILPKHDDRHKATNNLSVLIPTGVLVCVFVSVLAALCFLCRRRRRNIYSSNSALPLLGVSSPQATTRVPTPTANSGTTTQAIGLRRRSSLIPLQTSRRSSIYLGLKEPTSWTEPIFKILCTHLTGNWKMFMRHLPGDEEYKSSVDARCEQICDEVRNNVPEQIYTALREWTQACVWPNVSVESVLASLESMQDTEDLWKRVSDAAMRLNETIPEENKTA